MNTKYRVVISRPTERKLKSLGLGLIRSKQYSSALSKLTLESLEKLEKDGHIKQIGDKSYVYRVGQNDRLLFGERNGIRIIVEAGHPKQIIK